MAVKTYTFVYMVTDSGNTYYYKANAIQEIRENYEYANQYSDEEVLSIAIEADKIKRIKLLDTKRDGGLENPLNHIMFGRVDEVRNMLRDFFGYDLNEEVTGSAYVEGYDDDEDEDDDDNDYHFDGLFVERR